MRKRVSEGFRQFVDVSDQSDLEIAKISRELGIDIAVDLKGFTQDTRIGLFAMGCAPIQVSYLGYPSTMGAPYIDYIVADHILIPNESQQHYTEKIVYMPHSYQVNDSKRKIANRTFTRSELGLPEEGFVFCCFNNNYKILPETFNRWMRLLTAVKGSVLWLLEDNPTAAINLRREAELRGVDASRLIFAKRMKSDEHLARHRVADLFIDTFPCNAHTTASDALWAGLPVLTLMGQSFASRVAASLLNALDLSELITLTQDSYEARAIELAINPDLLEQIKAKLHRNRLTSPLFNGHTFARHLEVAYSQMYNHYALGISPSHIVVQP
jgi:predicted O-linked N-acetylglucosamine transferase (SPINDLY family)